jgi:hypothetical protein
MKPLKFLENNKRIFAWIYDIYFLILIMTISLVFFLGFDNELLNSDFFIFPIIGLIIICSFANIFFMYYYNKSGKTGSWGAWGFISILLGIFPYALIFVPLNYFIKLRPYWVGKKKEVSY